MLANRSLGADHPEGELDMWVAAAARSTDRVLSARQAASPPRGSAPGSVTITVGSFYIQLGPGTGEGVSYESVATLHDALGNRTVIDGSNGLPVQRATCPPAAYFAPVCA